MDIPIGGLEHTAKAPDGNRTRRPAGEFFQGFPPRKQRLHDDKPAEPKTVTMFPHAGEPTKQDRDEQGQVGARDHSKPRRTKGVNDQASSIPAVLFYHIPTSTLICKSLEVCGVVFE